MSLKEQREMEESLSDGRPCSSARILPLPTSTSCPSRRGPDIWIVYRPEVRAWWDHARGGPNFLRSNRQIAVARADRGDVVFWLAHPDEIAAKQKEVVRKQTTAGDGRLKRAAWSQRLS
jgi:hypothetical protein